MFGFPGMMHMGPFRRSLRCYSVAVLGERKEVEGGGKVILPPSALDHLTRLNIAYPMLFKITNPNAQRVSHCGVLEFVAEEGKVYMPYWMMKNLILQEGDIIEIESVSLPVATYVKFKPQSVDFLNISNPRAVLEMHLRSFACLTKSDIIAINYNDKIFEMAVQEVKPGNAVSIIECDMNVEFDAPVGYQEPVKPADKPPPDDAPIDLDSISLLHNKFIPFQGEGNRLDGKKKGTEPVPVHQLEKPQRGIPDLNYKPGKLTFLRGARPPLKDSNRDENAAAANFEAFGGEGRTIRDKKTKK